MMVLFMLLLLNSIYSLARLLSRWRYKVMSKVLIFIYANCSSASRTLVARWLHLTCSGVAELEMMRVSRILVRATHVTPLASCTHISTSCPR